MPHPSPHKNKNDTWFPVGPASSYPDITESGSVILSDTITTTTTICADNNDNDSNNNEKNTNDNNHDTAIAAAIPGCKVFSVPEHAENGEIMQAVQLSNDPGEQVRKGLRKGGQVVVFRYRGRIFAVDNKCPHSSHPLSTGTPFDIEDFGVVLSAGISCPKHGWNFDVVTGSGDRGGFALGVWGVEVRGGVVWVGRGL